MKSTTAFTRKDIVVVLGCVVFLLINLGAVGKSGRQRAKRAVCLANLRQLTLAWTQYADDNDGKIVRGDAGEYNSKHPNEIPWVLRDWPRGIFTDEQMIQAVKGGALFPYTKNVKLYRCTMAIVGEVRTYSVVDAMNATWLDAPQTMMIKKRNKIKRPGERLVFVDDSGATPMGAWSVHYTRNAWWDEPPLRHGNGANWSFADGHSEYWKWKNPDTRTFNPNNTGLWKHVERPGDVDIYRVRRAAWGKLPP